MQTKGRPFWNLKPETPLTENLPFWGARQPGVFCSVFKTTCVHTYRLSITFPVHTTTPHPFWKRCYTFSALAQMNSMHAHGGVCPPFWILTVEWSGAQLCLFWWRHRFQIASFSLSTLQNSIFKKHRFQITPLWRAFSNGSIFSDRFCRCSVDDSHIRSKTAPFSFENGLVWTGP